MAPNIVGQIPEFTGDAPPEEKVIEEVKEPVVEPAVEVKETPEPPAEKPGEEQVPPVDTKEPIVVQETEDQKAMRGLQEERVKLLKEISELKGQRREIKQDKLIEVNKAIDELKDLNPDDVTLIERVLRSKGYVTKEESSQMFYKAVETEELNKFLLLLQLFIGHRSFSLL